MACGTSSRVRRRACSRTSSATSSSSGWSLCCPSGKYTGPGGHGRGQPRQHLAEAVAAQRRDGEDLAARRQRRAPRRGARQAAGRRRRSILLSASTRRQVGAGDRLGDVAVAGPERLGRVEQHERGVDLAERVVDRRLHRARERVERLLETRQVEQHDLAALEVDHAGDAAARGLRVVADDAHLAPDEGVDERGLAHVGPARRRRRSRSGSRRSWPASGGRHRRRRRPGAAPRCAVAAERTAP